ncbi:MAG TPA: hypothetical protein VMD53_04585 [Rhizomicrobium sp.]|nr:hypothetical protein [Rhizomicrobium sp.]
MAVSVDNSVLATAADKLALQRLLQTHATIRTVVRWVAIVAIAGVAEQGVAALAGHSTSVIVSMALGLFADLKFSLLVTWAGGATFWAFLERNLRKRKVENMQGRIRSLEQRLDPNRSTSGLLPDGSTNPRDKLR